MKVTRDVILDLLPLYLANEGSEDTRALVKTFLEQDAELAQRVNEKPNELPFAKTPVPLTKEHEMQTLEQTKILLRLRSIRLGVAIFFSFAPLTGFSVAGQSWSMLRDFPAGAFACAIVAVVTWIDYFALRRKLRPTGL
jgi:hypothetical protein